MLTLRLFLIILATLLCREIGWSAATSVQSLPTLLSVLAACIGFGAVAKMSCILSLRSSGAIADGFFHSLQDSLLGRWQTVRQSLEGLWILCLPATLILTGWGSWIKQLDELGLLQSVSLLLWFAPSLVALVILELTTAQLEVYLYDLKSSLCAKMQMVVTAKYEGIERRASLVQVLDTSHAVPSAPASLQKILSARLRLGGISNVLACLLPVLLIASTNDVLKLLEVGWPESLKSLVASCIGLSAAAVCMPYWLSRWMGVTKFPKGALRTRTQGYCTAVGVKVEPMWVASEGRWAGAAVVGWLPGFRQLWLGDALVQQLSAEEVDMVLMHELAHIKRHHFLWRLIPVALACAVGLCTLGLFSETSSYAPASSYWQLSGQIAGMLLASGIMLFGISYSSRRCELDADAQACFLASATCPWSSGKVALAAQTLSQALVKLHRNSAALDRATWLHPAVSRRMANLASFRDTSSLICHVSPIALAP